MRRTAAFLSVFVLINLILPGLVPRASAGSTLDKIRAAKTLTCGINIEEPEYTLADAHGNRAAFDADLCKAVAVVVLGADAKFTVKPFQDEASSLAALKSGEIDLLATASPNLRNANGSFAFGRPMFYDFQGFLVDKNLGISSPRDFAGKKVCFLVGTEIGDQVSAYMAREKIKYIPGPFSEEGEMEAALVTGVCAAVTADVSQLAYERIAFKRLAKNFVIMPDEVAKDPLAPAFRPDDAQWGAIIDWTMHALIEAEEAGITQSNVAEMKKSDDIVVRRLLGSHHGWGQFLGLDDEWAARVIEAVGDYGQLFDRDLGSGSPMRLERGANNLWTHGGLMYANPIR